MKVPTRQEIERVLIENAYVSVLLEGIGWTTGKVMTHNALGSDKPLNGVNGNEYDDEFFFIIRVMVSGKFKDWKIKENELLGISPSEVPDS